MKRQQFDVFDQIKEDGQRVFLNEKRKTDQKPL